MRHRLQTLPTNLKLHTFLIPSFISSGLLIADGLPLNGARTHYKGLQALIKLNADQLEKVTVARTITLTHELENAVKPR
jgi:hypothetical protein